MASPQAPSKVEAPAGVAVVRWPEQSGRRDAARAAGVPCLLVVASAVDVPALAPCEDWVIETSDERDVAWRIEDLRQRAGSQPSSTSDPLPAVAVPPELDDGDRRVARILLQRVGELVPLDHLSDTSTKGQLAASIRRVSAALDRAGWEVVPVADRGYLVLEAAS